MDRHSVHVDRAHDRKAHSSSPSHAKDSPTRRSISRWCRTLRSRSMRTSMIDTPGVAIPSFNDHRKCSQEVVRDRLDPNDSATGPNSRPCGVRKCLSKTAASAKPATGRKEKIPLSHSCSVKSWLDLFKASVNRRQAVETCCYSKDKHRTGARHGRYEHRSLVLPPGSIQKQSLQGWYV